MARVSRKSQAQKHKIIRLLRGEIYLCAFDPTIGHEIRKTRPALVIQNDVGNRYSPLTIVAAITSKISSVPYPIEVIADADASNGLETRSSIRLDQIRTVDQQRLIRRLGVMDTATMAKVDEAIQISLGLVRI